MRLQFAASRRVSPSVSVSQEGWDIMEDHTSTRTVTVSVSSATRVTLPSVLLSISNRDGAGNSVVSVVVSETAVVRMPSTPVPRAARPTIAPMTSHHRPRRPRGSLLEDAYSPLAVNVMAVSVPSWVWGGSRLAGAGPQVLQDGQHPAVLVGVGKQVELGENGPDVLLYRAFRDEQPRRDPGVVEALGHSGEHLGFAWTQPVQHVVGVAAQQLRHHLRVDGGPAVGDTAQGLQELVDVGHAVFEQVADLGRATAQQLRGVGADHVLGEQQHRDIGMLLADPDRGVHAFFRVGWRHADVHQA